jgi:hypothetical protein
VNEKCNYVRRNVTDIPLISFQRLSFSILEHSCLGERLTCTVTKQGLSEHVRRNYSENFVQTIALHLQVFSKPDEEDDYGGYGEDQKVKEHGEGLGCAVRCKYEGRYIGERKYSEWED